MDASEALERRISGIAALDQPVRRDLYRLVAQREGWTSRDDAAAELGIPRSVAVFHLDKLAEAGLVEVTYRRTTGRTGPGAGRPSKLYRSSQDEVSASVPERHYDLAGSLLAAAVAEASETGSPIGDCLRVTARSAGRLIGTEARAATESATRGDDRRRIVLDVLSRHGYEPDAAPDGEISLANCPFYRLAEQHRSLVCGMNLDFLTGVVEGLGPGDRLDARLAPEPGFCCVRIDAA
jgi:predicted ArsR family transcriptional regulator